MNDLWGTADATMNSRQWVIERTVDKLRLFIVPVYPPFIIGVTYS